MKSLGVVVMVLLLSAGLAGAVVQDNVKLTVVTAPQGKEENGEKQVRAEALVGGINTSEQLKGITLELLDHLKTTYPNCRSYTIVLSNDARMMKIGNYLAVATFKDGRAVVTGGIPTYMDMRVMKVSKVEVRKPDELGMQVAFDVAMLKKEAAKKGKPLTDDKVYALVAKQHKLQVVQVRQMDRGITQYYKAFAGKAF
jgi:hypothetical protein